jgi:hypothetical protein
VTLLHTWRKVIVIDVAMDLELKMIKKVSFHSKWTKPFSYFFCGEHAIENITGKT